jgi:uncharacterized membrane protein
MRAIHSFNRLLIATFAFIALLILARIFYTGSLRHIFLLWNIFLAWIPYAMSCQFGTCQNKHPFKQGILFFTWLVFFPNALYIVTDLVHLQNNGNAPLWFDVILLFTSSFLGLILAFASLQYAERFLQHTFGHLMKTRLVPVILFLGSFGVYLGRFERWNSWDIIHSPFELAENIWQHIFFPAHYLRTWVVTVMLTILFYIIYGFSRYVSLKPHKDAGL